MGKIKKAAGNIPPSNQDISEKAECYRVLAETAQDVLMILDSRGVLLYVNNYGGELLGATPEAIIGKTLSDLFPKDIAQNMLANIRKVFDEGCPQDVEDRIPSVNGPVWFATRLVPLRDDEGSVNTVIGIARDITSRKKTEAALADTHDFLKNIMECTTNSIYVLDLEGKITFANQRAEEITGYTVDELRGKPFTLCATEKSLLIAQELFEKVTVHNRKFTGHEIEIVRKDKAKRTIIVGAAPMSQQGKIIGYVGTAEDITERKMIEESLRESARTARTLLNIPNAAAFLLDTKGICLDANEELARRFGKETSAIVGKYIFDLIPPEVRKSRRAHFNVVLREKKQVRFEDERNGMWNEVIVTPILDEQGEVEKVSVFGFDITDRKRIENALRESEKKAKADAQELEESYNALKVLLKQRENDKRELEEKILSNLKHLVFPYIEKLKKKNRKTDDELILVKIIESNLKEIVSPFSAQFSSKYIGLTPKEILIANLIRDGKQDKDIAEILGISLDTVKVHRKSIRKKLRISGARTNLRTYLLSHQ